MVNKSEKVVNGVVCELNFIRSEEFCPVGDTFLLEVCKTMPRHIRQEPFCCRFYIPKGRFFWYAYDALTYIGAVLKHAEGECMSIRCDVICALAYCDGHESSHIIKAHTDSARFKKKMVRENLC